MTNLELECSKLSAQLGTGVLQVVHATWNWSVPSCARNLELECSKLCAFFSNDSLVNLLINSFINFLCLPLSLKYQNKYIKQWNVVYFRQISLAFVSLLTSLQQIDGFYWLSVLLTLLQQHRFFSVWYWMNCNESLEFKSTWISIRRT